MVAKKIATVISGVKGRMGQALVCALAERDDQFLAGATEYVGHPDMGKKVFSGDSAKNPTIVSTIGDAHKGEMPAAVIEFTAPDATLTHLEECVALGIPMVIGTTGFDSNQQKKLQSFAQKIPVVMAANFSIGVNLMAKLVEELASMLPETYDLEIVEAHHNQKKDAPSGTALRLAQALADGRNWNLKKTACYHREGQIGKRPQKEIGIQTIRGGDIVGDHTVCFAGPGERLEVTHRAHSRMNFANGALRAVHWLWNEESETKLKTPKLYDMFDVLGLKKGKHS